MDWIILIIFSGAVVLASLGLIFLLFAEIFRGRSQTDNPARKSQGVTDTEITAEERASLMGSSSSGKVLSRTTSLFRRKSASAASAGKPQ